jgi:hypothetical protein
MGEHDALFLHGRKSEYLLNGVSFEFDDAVTVLAQAGS